MSAETVTALVERVGGRFKAVVGTSTEYGDSATCAARAAAAKHFKVEEHQIDLEAKTATLAVSVKGGRK